MFDEDYYNTLAKEEREQNWRYTQSMRTISQVLHDLHPSCNIEIRAKLTLEGLTEEDLSIPY